MNVKNENISFPTVSGRLVVLAMLGFGLVMTGAIWAFSVFELEPFQPLARAIKAEFPDSHPHVKGGRPKKQPPMLRIVMQVDFTPIETDQRVVQIVDRVTALSKEHINLAEYETLEIHIVHYVPEKSPEHVTVTRKVSDL
jgi:hypothetical protein